MGHLGDFVLKNLEPSQSCTVWAITSIVPPDVPADCTVLTRMLTVKCIYCLALVIGSLEVVDK